MEITFLGLGNMGLPVALNLVKAGHHVKSAVYKRPDGPEALKAAGGEIFSDVPSALKGSELIFTILPDDVALLSAMLEPAVLAAVEPGAVLVDMTSCSAQAVSQVAEAYAAKGVAVIDAPVSGGVPSARNAAMTLMCCGDKAAFEKVEPVLHQIGKQIFYLGEKVGTGKMVKSLNNLLCAVNKVALGEAIKIVKANGIDPKAFYDVVCVSSGTSKQFENTFFQVYNEDFTTKFALKLMRKDVDLALGLAEELDVPLSALVLERYRQAAAYDEEDSSAVAKL